MSNSSLPYLLVLAPFALGLAVAFWMALDEVVYQLLASTTWDAGGEEIAQGRSRMLWMWDHGPLWIITSYGIGMLIASRRR